MLMMQKLDCMDLRQTYLEMPLASAVTGHVAAQQATRALLLRQHNRPAPVAKQYARSCGHSGSSVTTQMQPCLLHHPY